MYKITFKSKEPTQVHDKKLMKKQRGSVIGKIVLPYLFSFKIELGRVEQGGNEVIQIHIQL